VTGYVYIDDQNPTPWYPGVPESLLSSGVERTVRLDDDDGGRKEEMLLNVPYVWLRVTEIDRGRDPMDGESRVVYGEDSELWLPANGGTLNGGRWLHTILE